MDLTKPPWYRRFWVVFLAFNLVFGAVLVVAVVALWPRAAPRPVDPGPAADAAPQAHHVLPQGAEPATTLASSTTARLESGVLWQRRGSDAEVGELFAAPGRWRVVWSFSCQSLAELGGGNFKLSSGGDFKQVSVQRFGVRGRGSLLVTGGGRGRLIIESVCERWDVKAVAA